MEFYKKFGKYFVAGFAALAAVFVSFMPLIKIQFVKNGPWSFYNISSLFSDGIKNAYVVIIGASLLLVGGVIALFINGKKVFNYLSTAALIAGTILVTIEAKCVELSGAYKNVEPLWGIIVISVLAAISTALSLTLCYEHDQLTVRDIAEEGMLVAMAFVLNLIKFFPMPTGGSVNLQMLPLFVLAIRHGPTHGLISGGIVYGMLTCLTDGYGIATYPLEYLLGFGSICILGFFRPLIIKERTSLKFLPYVYITVGIVLQTLVRYAGACADSMILWETPLGGEGGALAYNVYVLVSGALALAVTLLLAYPLQTLEKKYPVKHGYLL